jgi:cytochrome c oxidase accessory protein FixG
MSEAPSTFRDQLYNTDESGRRIGFFPKRPSGRYYTARTYVSIALLLIFFGLPWIKLNEQPFFMLNVLERKFIFFGATFWPQDFLLVALLIVTFAVFVFLFTAVLGRIWCGWACPQTIFLEMVYRRIEYWIEGDAPAQRRLNASDWGWEKIWKRSLKQGIFLLIAWWVSHTVLAFLLGMDTVLDYMRHSPAQHPVLFAVVLINTGVFYLVFSWFREQACIYMCPYGRLQGVLLDNDSLVIHYDHQRGEPRGKLKKNEPDASLGDCIDCRQCVAVCPTGIDIRHGTQLECVNCTACIDACDDIMDKIKRPRGLIRYASHNQIVTGKGFRLTGRAYLYIAVLAVFFITFLVLLLTGGDMKTTLLRSPGQTYTMTQSGNVTNLFTLNILNKLDHPRTFTFKLPETTGSVTALGAATISVPAHGQTQANLIVELPPSELKGLSFDVKIDMVENGAVKRTLKTRFNGPMF